MLLKNLQIYAKINNHFPNNFDHLTILAVNCQVIFFYAYIHLPPETSDIAAAPIGSGLKLAVLVFEIGVVLSLEFILEDKTL